MPELPEVETYARKLRDLVSDRVIAGVEVLWERSIGLPGLDEFRSRISGQQIVGVTRRGKYLIFKLHAGNQLLMHFKMSGRLYIEPSSRPRQPHDRVIFLLDNGEELRFNDARKFGRIYLVSAAHPVIDVLGPEPLDDAFTLDDFRAQLVKRKRAIKPLLLDQSFLAGLGNIYTDEALYRAGIHPLRKANQLTELEITALYHAIRDILQTSIEYQGTSFDGVYTGGTPESRAEYQAYLRVYRRAGKSCPRCQGTIERIVVGGRGTHFCPGCQRGNGSGGG